MLGQVRRSKSHLMGFFAAALERARHVLEVQSVLLVNSSALSASTIITAAMGFLYWWLAPHVSPHSVGSTSAAIWRFGGNQPVRGRDLLQPPDMTEQVDHLKAGLAVVSVAPERSGPNATNWGLGKIALAERIDLAERHCTAIAERAVLDRA